MHTGEPRGVGGGELTKQRGAVRRVREIIHVLPETFAGTEDVGVRYRGIGIPTLGEQISAQECACRLLKEVSTLPAMREMGRIQPLQRTLAGRDDFSVGQRARRTIKDVSIYEPVYLSA